MGAVKIVTIGCELLAVCLMLACGIVWCLIGADNVDKGCVVSTDGTPDIATWLIIEGALLLGLACTSLLLLPLKFHFGKKLAIVFYLFAAVNLIAALFHIAWLIVGAIRVSESECNHGTPIYKTSLAAVILGFFPLIWLSIFFSVPPLGSDD